MKRKKLEKQVEDLEQRLARLETLDDQLARDVLAMKGTAKKVKLTRLSKQERDCGDEPFIPGKGRNIL